MYKTWLTELNGKLVSELGLGVENLSDYDFEIFYEENMTHADIITAIANIENLGSNAVLTSVKRKMKQESAVVLYDGELISYSVGSAGRVEFDFMEVWAFKKTQKDFDPAKLVFIHTHPEGFLDYSSTDLDCMKGFLLSFNHPVTFSIMTFPEGSIRTYSYDGNSVVETEDPFVSDLAVNTLYFLSYIFKVTK
jgi:proteasome lid subunit RPN8/RPN11